MSKLASSVNNCLKQMQAQEGRPTKGVFGEQAVFKVCEMFYQQLGGILYHSYSYKTEPTCAGNVKRNEQGNLYIENLGSSTEIDVLLVTKYKVFPIEVKAYKAAHIKLTDSAIEGCYITNKSPIHQNEMHCRHLYAAIAPALPEGSTSYIEPIVVFVDKCGVTDAREPWQKDYIKAVILKKLASLLLELNKPLDYSIDLNVMEKYLKEACVSSEVYLPYLDI